jgi:prophage antirepressor-like protein
MSIIPSAALQVFAFEGAEIRTLLIDDEPWWVAADVCAVLHHTNPTTAVAGLDEDEKGLSIVETPGGPQQMVTVNEPGLYSLTFRSRKKEAKTFKRWVTHEVLPALRKHGTYMVAPADEPKAIAAAGPVSYLEQAQIVAVLVQAGALPVPYATATSKIIVARSMGERPELEAAETPLYAATFLAEQGHSARTVREFQSGFGLRVSNRYFKVHGRRPEKIPGPAGSRIDKVAVYSEDDRPLLQEVYDQIADLIGVFEHGNQLVIEAGAA